MLPQNKSGQIPYAPELRRYALSRNWGPVESNGLLPRGCRDDVLTPTAHDVVFDFVFETLDQLPICHIHVHVFVAVFGSLDERLALHIHILIRVGGH